MCLRVRHRVGIIVAVIIAADDFAVRKSAAAEHRVCVVDSRITDGDGDALSVIRRTGGQRVHQRNPLGKLRVEPDHRLDGFDQRMIGNILQALLGHKRGKARLIIKPMPDAEFTAGKGREHLLLTCGNLLAPRPTGREIIPLGTTGPLRRADQVHDDLDHLPFPVKRGGDFFGMKQFAVFEQLGNPGPHARRAHSQSGHTRKEAISITSYIHFVSIDRKMIISDIILPICTKKIKK